MPFVRITVTEAVTKVERKLIAEAVHHSLMEAFHVPADDFFQVMEVVKGDLLFYPESYLGIQHTEKMLFVQITAASGRTYEQKEQLYEGIARRISAATSVLIGDIFIVLTENGSRENWSFGNGKIQLLTHIK